MEGNLLDTFSVATVVALIFVVVMFLRNVVAMFRPENTEAKASVVNQVVAWLAGVIVVLFVAQADIAQNIEFFGARVGDMDVASLILVGLCATSAGGVLNDFFASRDASRTSAVADIVRKE